jgi:phosphatidate phosphatase PAH1
LDFELNKVNKNNVTNADIEEKKQIRKYYFADLTKYLKNNDTARAIFLEKSEVTDSQNNTSSFTD